MTARPEAPVALAAPSEGEETLADYRATLVDGALNILIDALSVLHNSALCMQQPL